MHCGLGSQQSQLESHKYGSKMFWGLAKARNIKMKHLAFYFIDPFPMFLVRDHFSWKSHHLE